MIDTKALRSRILDLAIQGKLTEQLPSDGTAEELYQQIQAEKQALIKEGKIKKEKPLPEISADEIPFEIPSNWMWMRLGNFIHIESGKGLTAHDMKEGCIPVYGGNGINGYHSTANVHKKTVVIGRVGVNCGSVHLTEENAWVTDNAFITTYPEKHINQEFLVHTLRFLNLGERQNATAQPVISGKKIYPVLFPIPPLAEQKRIVERVEEIFRLLDTIDQAQEKYSADSQILKAKLITAGIQGKLTKQLPSDGTAEELYQQIQAEKQKLIKEGKLKKEKPLPPVSPDEVPFEIPENWLWVRLNSLGTFSSGKTPSMAESAYWDGDIPWVTSKDMKTRIIKDSEMHITELGAENMQIYPAGTLLLVVRSGILRRMLPLCVLGVNSTINQDLKAFSLYDLSISPWLYFAIKAFEPYILKNLVKAMTTVESLKFDEFASMLLPLPPLAEQKRIADVLERALGALDNKQ